MTSIDEVSIREFAKRTNIHPGIILGRLQYLSDEYKLIKTEMSCRS